MRVHLCQLDIAWHDRPANHAAALRLLENARPAAGDLVVLPEMFPVGFSMDVAAIADRQGETARFIPKLAKDFGVFVIAGNIIQPDDRGRNEALVAGPDGVLLATYHKLHPFRFAGEHHHYRDGVVTFDWNGIAVSPLICYDLRFPEAFRLAIKAGAEMLVVIANWPTARVAHWLALLTARAIENQAYVVGVNRVGRDPNNAYPGRSVVIDPRGNTLLDAGDQAGCFGCEIDIAVLRDYREKFPALADIRFI